MSGEAQVRLQLFITDMSQNLILKFEVNGSIWAKITPVRRQGDVNPGIVYINGNRYTVNSEIFVQIFA